jgi:hypothetical protein
VVVNEESFEDIHEFTDIARPVVADEIVQECRANGWHTNPEPGGELPKQELSQARKVFPSISKRGHFDADYIQPKEEVSPESPSTHLGLQITVRRRDNSSRHYAGMVTPHSLVHLILKNSKQLGLQREAQFADLIQEKGSACCGFESPDARHYRARESAAFVPEELAFDQRSGQPRAVRVNICASASRGKLVKQASGEALSGTGFTGDEDGRAKRRNRAEFSPNLPDSWALAD